MLKVRTDVPLGMATLADALNRYAFNFAHVAVDVFIVLSGYCLMLPVAASSDNSLRGGFWAYIRRRARRILIPYYAALALSLIICIAAGFRNYSGPILLTHILLVHNFHPDHLFALNAAMWSIAVEWQIYFVFALVLLPVWRQTGGPAVLLFSLVLGLAPLYLLPVDRNFDWSCPWYITLFTLGMLASTDSRTGVGKSATPLILASWISAVAVPVVYLLQSHPQFHTLWVSLFRQQNRGVGWPLDLLVGVAVATFLAAMARSATSAGLLLSAATKTLESRLARFLGTISYSLYLIHSVMIAVLALFIQRRSMSPTTAYVLVWLFGPAFGIAAGYVLYHTVERYCSWTVATTSASASAAPVLM